ALRDDAAAHAGRAAHAHAVDLRPRRLPDLQRLGIVAIIDPDLREDRVGVRLDPYEPLLVQHLVDADPAGDVRHAGRGAGKPRGALRLAAAGSMRTMRSCPS